MATVEHDDAGPPFVSTGRLPPVQLVQELVTEAHDRFTADRDGETSSVYPALRRVEPDLFGVCVVGADGHRYTAGDADVTFTIMSVAKPFVFALVCAASSPDEVRRRIGVNATGRPFNSLAAVEGQPDGRTNPMVNPGAIATTSLAPGAAEGEGWPFIVDGLSRFAGRDLTIDDEVYASASATNHRNRAMAELLESYGRLGCEQSEALDLYTKQSSLRVSASDLAVMGATLADGGVNPLTGERVVDVESCRSRAGRHEHGRALRDVGRLALRGGPTGQERDRRRDRHGVAGQGRAGHVRTPAGCGGQQREGPTRRPAPLPSVGARPVRVPADLARTLR